MSEGREQSINKLIDMAYRMFYKLRKAGNSEEQSLKTVILALVKKLDD
jgi:hypothetical protein